MMGWETLYSPSPVGSNVIAKPRLLRYLPILEPSRGNSLAGTYEKEEEGALDPPARSVPKEKSNRTRIVAGGSGGDGGSGAEVRQYSGKRLQ